MGHPQRAQRGRKRDACACSRDTRPSAHSLGTTLAEDLGLAHLVNRRLTTGKATRPRTQTGWLPLSNLLQPMARPVKMAETVTRREDTRATIDCYQDDVNVVAAPRAESLVRSTSAPELFHTTVQIRSLLLSTVAYLAASRKLASCVQAGSHESSDAFSVVAQEVDALRQVEVFAHVHSRECVDRTPRGDVNERKTHTWSS